MEIIETAVHQCALAHPDKLAVADEREEISYGELYRAAGGFAQYLLGLSLPLGARVLVRAKPAVPTLIAYLGIHIAGLVNVPCEATAGPDALAAIAAETGASLVISDIELPEGADRLPYEKIRELADANADGMNGYTLPARDPEALYDVLFTTGTTGKSKGVMISARGAAACAENLICGSGIGADTVYLIPVPINHANGIRKCYATLCAGGTVVLADGLSNIKRFYEALEKYKADFLLLPPSAVRMLLMLSAKRLAAYADQIRLVHTSAAPFPEADKLRLCEILPKTRLVFAYGSSEVGNVSMFDYAAYPGRICCVGKLNVNAEVRIVDADRRDTASSKEEPGLIALGGAAVMLGYYNAPELTAGVLENGWVYTSDLGYFDGDGFLYVLGRADDVINVGGLKIAPTEVENVVMQFPGVAECACFGVDDPMTGKKPVLLLVPDRGKTVELTELSAFLEQRMEAYKIPKKFITADRVPKTSNGKVDRKAIIKQYG